jgi:hypothetical protein
MTTLTRRLLPDKLRLDAEWFHPRLRIYARVVASALGVVFVAFWWMARASTVTWFRIAWPLSMMALGVPVPIAVGHWCSWFSLRKDRQSKRWRR